MPYYITFHLFMCQPNFAPVASTETRNEKARASCEARAFFWGKTTSRPLWNGSARRLERTLLCVAGHKDLARAAMTCAIAAWSKTFAGCKAFARRETAVAAATTVTMTMAAARGAVAPGWLAAITTAATIAGARLSVG